MDNNFKGTNTDRGSSVSPLFWLGLAGATALSTIDRSERIFVPKRPKKLGGRPGGAQACGGRRDTTQVDTGKACGPWTVPALPPNDGRHPQTLFEFSTPGTLGTLIRSRLEVVSPERPAAWEAQMEPITKSLKTPSNNIKR